MMKHHFVLYPVAATADLNEVTTIAEILRDSNTLIINCETHGNFEGILNPGMSETRSRKNKLWEQTCFELFLAVRDAPFYWEFNFSPSGHWNIYSFKNYREGMKEETAFTELPFRVDYKEGHILSCSLEIDLNKIVRPDSRLEAAVNAIIEYKDGTLTYWALTNGIGRPDFHRRDSFIIDL